MAADVNVVEANRWNLHPWSSVSQRPAVSRKPASSGVHTSESSRCATARFTTSRCVTVCGKPFLITTATIAPLPEYRARPTNAHRRNQVTFGCVIVPTVPGKIELLHGFFVFRWCSCTFSQNASGHLLSKYSFPSFLRSLCAFGNNCRCMGNST